MWEWVEDCLHRNYEGAPTDGSAWTAHDCKLHVARGGSWLGGPLLMRDANRIRTATPTRGTAVGFRVARTLAP